MAATIELEHKETGEKVWRYTVDAKEILASPGCPWKITNRIRKAGWATPTKPVQVATAAQHRQKTLATEVVQALAAAGVLKLDEPEVADASPALAAAMPETAAEAVSPELRASIADSELLG